MIKDLLGLGQSLSGTLLMYDALGTEFYRVAVPRARAARGAGPKADGTPKVIEKGVDSGVWIVRLGWFTLPHPI